MQQVKTFRPVTKRDVRAALIAGSTGIEIESPDNAVSSLDRPCRAASSRRKPIRSIALSKAVVEGRRK